MASFWQLQVNDEKLKGGDFYFGLTSQILLLKMIPDSDIGIFIKTFAKQLFG